MPKIQYVEKKISEARLKTITRANVIIAEYAAQGFTLTLRQLYYQFVSRNLIPNSQKEYALLGDVINDGRLVGLIDWHSIIDRTRNIQAVRHFTSPEHAITDAAKQFFIDKWRTQPVRVEIWIEKDALAGVVDGICTKLDVPYFSCRGYTSQSEMWAGAQRLLKYLKAGQKVRIFHFGDHDPSGKDMTRDIRERLALFCGQEVRVTRLALRWAQIQAYKPPPNPAKLSDSRAKKYIAKYGASSWELDALEPAVIVGLITDAVTSVRDENLWESAAGKEHHWRGELKEAATKWQSIAGVLKTL